MRFSDNQFNNKNQQIKGDIALMTWYRYSNYGSVLQAYALSRVLREMGLNVDFVNYDPQNVIRNREQAFTFFNFFKTGFSYLKDLKNQPVNNDITREREKKYDEFRKLFVSETEPVTFSHELYSLNRQYDAFVCGSDQIWSPLCFDPAYFLDFVADAKKKIAYAPSIGRDDIPDQRMRNWYQKLLSDFNHLSTREIGGSLLVERISDCKCETVIDPTLLLSWDEWRAISSSEIEISTPYCLCYFLGQSKTNISIARKIAKLKGLKLLTIPVAKEDFSAREAIPNPVGPRDFIGLINGAEFVCTDSFHGMLFSVNSRTPFAVFNRFSYKDPRCQNARIDSFLSIAGLKDRKVTSETNINDFLEKSLDFNYIDRVNAFKEKSLEYLKHSIEDAISLPLEKKSINITNTCISCGACSACCPTNAIYRTRDFHGYETAKIDLSKCINCGKCIDVCPFSEKNYESFHETVKNYSFTASSEVKETCSSGGFAPTLSVFASNHGYEIWGCSYDYDSHKALHVCAQKNDTALLDSFKGSKYIKSDTWDAFSAIAKDKKSKSVFFGTPCQVAAVKKIVGQNSDSWLFVDLICHGVPTIIIWDHNIDRLKYITGENGISKIKFRDKSSGWRRLLFSAFDNNGECFYSADEDHDPYMRVYKSGIFDYQACKECPFRTASVADIRIGDYWGPWFENDDEGVSEVLALTKKGKTCINKIRSICDVSLSERPLDEYFEGQGIARDKHNEYSLDRFEKVNNFDKIDKLDFESFCRWCCGIMEKKNKQDKRLMPLMKVFNRLTGK